MLEKFFLVTGSDLQFYVAICPSEPRRGSDAGSHGGPTIPLRNHRSTDHSRARIMENG
jgi:hypothetical protein